MTTTTIVNDSTIARVAKHIPALHSTLWAALAPELIGARLAEVAAELRGELDPEASATWSACALVIAEDERTAPPEQPVARGLAEVAQVVGEVSVVAGAARWAAGAVAAHVRRALDRRRQERLSGIEPSSLIELDGVPMAGKVSR